MVRPARRRARPSSTGRCCRSSPRTAGRRSSSCPPHARAVGPIELWSEAIPRAPPAAARRAAAPAIELPGAARARPDRVGGRQRPPARGADLVPAPPGRRARASFRSRRAWDAFTAGLGRGPRRAGAGRRDAAARRRRRGGALYQSLYWVARTAAVADAPHRRPARHRRGLGGDPGARRTRRCTARRSCSPSTASTCARPTWPRCRGQRLARAAGSSPRGSPAAWPAPPTPAPTSSRRSPTPTPSGRRGWASTRPRSTSSTTASAPPAQPVAAARHPDGRVGRAHRSAQGHPHDAPGRRARRCAMCPARRSCITGPVTEGEEDYGRSCRALHARLGLGERFRFMGRTTDPEGVVRDADVVLMSSISEALPLSILEAMGQGTPGRLHRRRRRARRGQGLRRDHRAGRRPRAGDGRRHAAAPAGPGVAPRPTRTRAGSPASSTRRPACRATATCSARAARRAPAPPAMSAREPIAA